MSLTTENRKIEKNIIKLRTLHHNQTHLHPSRRKISSSSTLKNTTMARVKTRRTKPAPEGFEKIKPTLTDFDIQLRDAQRDKSSKLASKSNEQLWEIMQIHHQRSRYIYTLYYKRKAISKDLYEWLVREKYADKLLIAKWRKSGYEKLCCLRCIQKNETNNGSSCICRVPRAQLEEEAHKKDTQVSFHQCVHCGCRGCASTD